MVAWNATSGLILGYEISGAVGSVAATRVPSRQKTAGSKEFFAFSPIAYSRLSAGAEAVQACADKPLSFYTVAESLDRRLSTYHQGVAGADKWLAAEAKFLTAPDSGMADAR